MKMMKISWSDKKQNEYVNYYAFLPQKEGDKPVVMKAPIAMPVRMAKEQYNSQCIKAGLRPYDGPVMYVRLDLASGRMYFPEMKNLGEMNSDQARTMFDAVKIAASMEFGSLPSSPPIAGNPSKVLRTRSIEDFRSSARFIRAHLNEESLSNEFVNLPIVEANLSLMPETVNLLPARFKDLKYQGGYIGNDDNSSVTFLTYDSPRDKTRTRQIHIQKSPFILINTSPEAKVGESDKERIVVTGYKDFCTRGKNSIMVSSVGKYTVKYLLYMGYSFKDVCSSFISSANIKDFGQLMQMGAYLMSAARDLKKSGYSDPAGHKWYYCFKVDNTFPFKFKLHSVGQPYPVAGQSELMTIVHFDVEKSFLIFKTPLYISDDVCEKILNSKGVVTRCEYDPSDKKIKTDEPVSGLDGQSRYTTGIVKSDMTASGILSAGEKPKFEERHRVEARFTKRKISDYYQANDIIKSLITKLNKGDKKVEFHDMPVIVGPWEEVMNIAGGYTNMAKIKELGVKVPLQPVPGVDWYVMPPFIMIDNSKNASIADQTHIIIHEYRHHLNEQMGVESPSYDILGKNKDMNDAIRKRLQYLASPDERESHIEQMEYLLGIGWTKDDIIKHFMGGEDPSMATRRVAMKYLEFAEEASRRGRAAEEEAVGEEVLDKMLANMDDTDIGDEA